MQTTALISGHQLLEAFDEITIKLNGLNNWELNQKFAEINRTYSMMLEYIRRGQDDPMTSRLYNQVVQQSYALNDLIERHIRLNNTKYELYKNKHTNLPASATLANMLMALENYAEEKARGFVTDHQGEEAELQHDKLLSDLFTLVWTSAAWSKPEAEQAAEMLYSDKIDTKDKAIVVSAVTLSLIEYFYSSTHASAATPSSAKGPWSDSCFRSSDITSVSQTMER